MPAVYKENLYIKNTTKKNKMLRHLSKNHLKVGASTYQLHPWQQQSCCYHSEKGVFGYRPRARRQYKGNNNA